MRKLRKLLGTMLLVCVMSFCSTVSVHAATAQMVVNTTASANAGDTVYAQIVLNNNPGICTIGIAMNYDDEVLTYEGAQWNTEITSGSGSMPLISNLEDENLLNISSIMSTPYDVSGEALVTIKFTAKQSFSSMPIEVEVRDVSDAEEEDVEITLSKGTLANNSGNDSNGDDNSSDNGSNDSENQGGSNSSENDNSGNNGDNNSGADNSGNAGDANSGTTGNDNSNNSNNAGSNNSGNTGSNSSNNSNSSDNSTNNNLDKTFKTGAVDVRIVLGVIAVVLLGVAGVCIKVLRKREY